MVIPDPGLCCGCPVAMPEPTGFGKFMPVLSRLSAYFPSSWPVAWSASPIWFRAENRSGPFAFSAIAGVLLNNTFCCLIVLALCRGIGATVQLSEFKAKSYQSQARKQAILFFLCCGFHTSCNLYLRLNNCCGIVHPWAAQRRGGNWRMYACNTWIEQ